MRLQAELLAHWSAPLASDRDPFERDVLTCLRPGDVLLVEGSSRLSTVIKYLTQSTWSHAALCVGSEAAERAGGRPGACFVEADLVEEVARQPLEMVEVESQATRRHQGPGLPSVLSEEMAEGPVQHVRPGVRPGGGSPPGDVHLRLGLLPRPDLARGRVTVEARFLAELPDGTWETIWSHREVADATRPRPELEARIRKDLRVRQILENLQVAGIGAQGTIDQAVQFGAATMEAHETARARFQQFHDRYLRRLEAPPVQRAAPRVLRRSDADA